jgi:cytochrome b6-f complex iron-sulfur subunit
VRRRKRGDQFAEAIATGEAIPSGRIDDPEDADALRAAIALRAGQTAADLPSGELVGRLRQELAAETRTASATGPANDRRRVSRRLLLGSAGAVAAGAAGIALDRSVLGGSTVTPAASGNKAGPLDPVDGEWLPVASDAELSDGAPRRFATASVVGFVTSTEDGPVAVSGACTHLGCLLQQNDTAGRLDCPCHRTAFGHDGRVLYSQLPTAPAPLPTLQLRRRDGNVEVLVPRQV